MNENSFIGFLKRLDSLKPLVGLVATVAPAYLVALLYFGGSPATTDVGYQPKQPVPYSHALHAGELGLDCRYCHNTVEHTAEAAIPPTHTCMNCHTNILPQSPDLEAVRQSWSTGLPLPWIRVHDLPDFAFFNHSVHVNRGVGCEECHGRVDRMEVIYQAETLSMSWCLDCHRSPAARLRPAELVTHMGWSPGDGVDRETLGRELIAEHGISPPEDCSACHR